MTSVIYKDGYAPFINAVAQRRGDIKNWTALIVQSTANDNKPVPIDEIVQILEFQFQGNDIFILTMKIQQRVLIVTKNKDKKALSIIEQSLAETFPEGAVKVSEGIPLSRGLEYLCRQLSGFIAEADIPAQISLKRLARPSNTFLSVHSDIQVVNQLTQKLRGFGHVAMSLKAGEIYDLYRQYAPNVVFLDEYILNSSETSVIKKIRNELDPYAYIIVISKEASKKRVLQYKQEGADGFIIQPIVSDVLFKHLDRVKTFAPSSKV